MIDVTESNLKYDVCLSCGKEGHEVKKIAIRRRSDANANIMTLCVGCIAEIAFQAGADGIFK